MIKLSIIDFKTQSLTERTQVPIDDDIAKGYAYLQISARDSLDEDRREAIYVAMANRVDKGFGKIVEHLKGPRDYKNTIIIITSDNGACYEQGQFRFEVGRRKGITELQTNNGFKNMNGKNSYLSYGSSWANLCNTPFKIYKHVTHERGVCVPLIINFSDKIPHSGSFVPWATHLIDIKPTLIELSRAKYPKEFDHHKIPNYEGISLYPTIIDGKD